MVRIIICSHGTFAQAMLDSAQMIVGPQENVEAFGMAPGADLDEYKSKVENAILEAVNQQEDVILFTDIFSGTPFNTAVGLMSKYPALRHFCGVNMPILLEIVSSRDFMSFEELCAEAARLSKKSIVDVNAFIESVNDSPDAE